MSWLDHFRCPLHYGEMFQLAWQLTWPAVVLDASWSIVTNVLLDMQNPALQAVFAIPYLLFIGPHLVRRIFRQEHEGFRLKAFRGNAPAELGHAEAFKVFWLLSWRVMIPMLVLLLVVSFFLRFVQVELASLVPSSKDAPLFNAIGLTLVENGAALFLLPFVMPGMFAKRFQGFRLSAERKTQPSSVAQPRHQHHSPKHQKRS
ncbi:MAG: hypothetical protein HY820_32925 [Acidobacteria bacterium]|nr:hypothetical protein [Acidobacteriota bacterium]